MKPGVIHLDLVFTEQRNVNLAVQGTDRVGEKTHRCLDFRLSGIRIEYRKFAFAIISALEILLLAGRDKVCHHDAVCIQVRQPGCIAPHGIFADFVEFRD